MAVSTIAASATVRAKGPTWSRVQLTGKTPKRETRPNVGFSPTTPQREAGILIDPPESVPRALKQRPAATAAPDPALEAPGCISLFQGFLVGPKNDCLSESVYANSCKLSLPMIIAPASFRRFTTVAS